MTTAESDILQQLRAWRDAGGVLSAGVATELIAAWYRSAESGES